MSAGGWRVRRDRAVAGRGFERSIGGTAHRFDDQSGHDVRIHVGVAGGVGMASRKTDVVRRSSFGAGDMDRTESLPAPSRKRSARQSRGSTEPVPAMPQNLVDHARAESSEPRRRVEFGKLMSAE